MEGVASPLSVFEVWPPHCPQGHFILVSAFSFIISLPLFPRFPKALVLYLEHLVFDRKIDSEEFHTHLALLYYERLLEISVKSTATDEEKEDASTEDTRTKLRQLLKTSHQLRLQLLLEKLRSQSVGFEYEEALLHAKLGDYTSALKVRYLVSLAMHCLLSSCVIIYPENHLDRSRRHYPWSTSLFVFIAQVFVHRLKDVDAAEKFCVDFAEGSSDPEKIRQKLVTQLLHVYLDPKLRSALIFFSSLIFIMSC